MRRSVPVPCLAAALLASCGSPRPAPPPRPAGPPVSCRPDRERPLPPAAGRRRLCLIDVGSRNVKLLVASVAPDGDPRTLADERVCRSRLQLGEKTFDQATRTPRPLSAADQQTLAALMADYRALCERDEGSLAGAVATEWARRATNAEEVQRTVAARVGVPLEVLTREREGRYGYLAAARGVRGKVALDFGSRSLQVSFWPAQAAEPRSASVPLGIDEAGDRFFGDRAHRAYGPARDAFVAAVAPGLEALLEELRAAQRERTVGTELYSLGENGDIALAIEGRLWDGASARPIDEPAYGALLGARSPQRTAAHGEVTAVIPAAELEALGRVLEAQPALFEALRGDPIKRVFGYKVLAYPALVGWLARRLGVQNVVLVPQEMPLGALVERLQTRR